MLTKGSVALLCRLHTQLLKIQGTTRCIYALMYMCTYICGVYMCVTRSNVKMGV